MRVPPGITLRAMAQLSPSSGRTATAAKGTVSPAEEEEAEEEAEEEEAEEEEGGAEAEGAGMREGSCRSRRARQEGRAVGGEHGKGAWYGELSPPISLHCLPLSPFTISSYLPYFPLSPSTMSL